MQLRSAITIQDNIARLAAQQEELIKELRRLAAPDDEQRTSIQNRIGAGPPRNESLAGGLEVNEIPRAEGVSQEYRGSPSRETTGSDVQQTNQIYPAPNHISQRSRNPFRTQQFAPQAHLNPTPMSSPYPWYQNHPFLAHIRSSNGQFKFTSIAGNQTSTDSSNHIVNTNSGNTTTTITTDSNNDTSVRTLHGS